MSQDLLDGLDTLDRWPDKVKLMQTNWIGRSEGLLIRWPLVTGTAPAGETELEVYTTRPDTMFGASFMAIAADHPLARKAAAANPALQAFIDEIAPWRHLGGRDRDGREAGLRHRHPRRASVRSVLDAAGLCREFRADGLRHGRDLRLPRA